MPREALQLEVERAGLEARREAILKNVARIKDAKEKTAPRNPDPELVRLDAAVQVCERQIGRLLEASQRVPGSVAQADIDVARIELTVAKAETDAKRNALAEKTPALLPELNRQLTDLEIRSAEVQAHLQTISAILRQVKEGPLLALLAHQAEVTRSLEQRTARLSREVQARDDLKRKLALAQGPRVTIIDLEAKPEPQPTSPKGP